MKEKGVLSQSEQYFHIPSEFAKKVLYYPTLGGNYYCSSEYETKRDKFNQYYFCYIKEGKMEIGYKEEKFIAKQNDFVFLDCFSPHFYTALENSKITWLHFKGSGAKEYFKLLYKKQHGPIFTLEGNREIPTKLDLILTMMQEDKVNEHLASILIQQILYELTKISKQDLNEIGVVNQANLFIENNYHKDISLEDIARHVNLSPYHFSRLFKEQTNFTPNQYLINYRINCAKDLLYKTNLSICEIAYRCGFNSDSYFATTFKKHTGYSPKKYQKFIFKI